MNKVVLSGRLTKDVEFRATQDGTTISSFTVAVNRKYKDQNGNYPTDFINCKAFRNTADFIKKYFHKGDRINLEGEIRTGSYDDKDGNKKYTFDVIANEVEIVESKKQEENKTEEKEKKVEESDPFAEFGETVEREMGNKIDDNFLD